MDMASSQPEEWSMYLQGFKVSKLDYIHVSDTLWVVPGMKYWAVKHDLTLSNLVVLVNWDSCGDTLQSLSFAQHSRCLVKHASSHYGHVPKEQ
jgi:hypothetical protein